MASSRDSIGDVVGGVSLIAGILVSALALRALASGDKDLNLWVGAAIHVPSKYPTFDFYVGAIGHALAPWSAFLPFALGRLLLTPVLSEENAASAERESMGRVAVLVGASVAFVAHALLVAQTDLIAFSGPALCAMACAIAIRDFERGAHASIAVGLGTLVFAGVLHHDFHELPEKAYEAFGIASATFPEGFKDRALGLWWVVLGGFAVCAFLTWVERDADRTPFAPTTYARVLLALREVYDGSLAFVYGMLVAAAAAGGIAVLVGTKTHAHWLPQMSGSIRDGAVNAWWILALGPLGGLFSLIFVCDVWLWAFGRSEPFSRRSFVRGFEPFEHLYAQLRSGSPHAAPKNATKPSAHAAGPGAPGDGLTGDAWWIGLLVVAPLMVLALPAVAVAACLAAGVKWYIAALLAPSSLLFFVAIGIVGDLVRHRAAGLALGGGLVGFVLCFFYYPALANQLSPKEVFESYRHVCPDGPLALLGVGGRTSAYYAGGQPRTLTEATSAYQWLSSGGGQRRCLAMKADELPKMNQLWRQHGSEPRSNLPILDARSSQILLAASSLGAGEHNQNPLGPVLLDAVAHPERKLDVNLDDKLQVLGVDIVDDRGRAVEAVSAGRTYVLKTYYRVLAPLTSEWEAFIHIDGYHRRHNGDHKPINGKYPMSLWLTGDVLVDDYEFKLEPNFTPGTYTIYFGLFVGDTRMKVLSGPSDGDNRINGGPLRVQ